MIEHGLGGPRLGRQIGGDARLNLLLALGGESLLLGLAPRTPGDEIGSQSSAE